MPDKNKALSFAAHAVLLRLMRWARRTAGNLKDGEEITNAFETAGGEMNGLLLRSKLLPVLLLSTKNAAPPEQETNISFFQARNSLLPYWCKR